MFRPSVMSYAVIVRLLTMSIIWLLLLVWQLNAYRLNCALSIAMVAMLMLPLIIAGTEMSYFHRRALFNECLHKDSLLFGYLHNRVLMTLRELLFSLTLAVLLLTASLLFEPRQWSILFADILLIGLLIPRLANGMGNEVREEYRYAMARQWAMWISTLLLWGESLLVIAFASQQDYFGMRWQEVITYAINDPDLLCPVVAEVTHVYMTLLALAQWAIQNASRLGNDPTQAVIIWTGLISVLAFSFLTALAYSRALVGVMGRPWEMWRSFSRPDDDAVAGPCDRPS